MVTINAHDNRPPLTGRQAEILQVLTRFVAAKGYGPSIRDIAREMGIKSPNGVMCHVRALRKKGYLPSLPRRPGTNDARATIPTDLLPVLRNAAEGYLGTMPTKTG